MTTKLDQTLLDRGCQYGPFADVAHRTARIYHHMVFKAPQFATTKDLSLYYEALHMIAMKVARLVNGQINDAASWLDIAGYAMLVHNQIEQAQEDLTTKADQDDLATHPAIAELDKDIAAIFKESRA